MEECLPPWISPIDFGWVVGIIEGEGAITWHPPSRLRRGYVRIQVAMTDLDILEKLKEITGKGTIGGPYLRKCQNGSPAKPIWHWAVQRQDDVFELLFLLHPFMGERRRSIIEHRWTQYAEEAKQLCV